MTSTAIAPARPKRLTTCLFCDNPLPPDGGVRGCCTGRCAYLEHDQHDDYFDPED